MNAERAGRSRGAIRAVKSWLNGMGLDGNRGGGGHEPVGRKREGGPWNLLTPIYQPTGLCCVLLTSLPRLGTLGEMGTYLLNSGKEFRGVL